MDALEAIRARYSERQFNDQDVDKELIERIIEAGRVAPTARGECPWVFVAVTKREALKKLGDATDYGKFIASGAFCVAVFCKDTKYYLEDGCAATENMLIAATALGVGSCWVAGDKKPYVAKVSEMLGAPAGYRLVSMVVFGYPSKKRPPSPKKPLKEVLRWEKFQ